VPELNRVDVGVVLCAADTAALDALVPPGYGSRALRTAPDEVLFVCEPSIARDVAREVRDRVAALDEDALVLDVSDGWAAARLAGNDARTAFSFVSELAPPGEDDELQGDVARVHAKVLGDADGITLLVPAYWGHHLRTRLTHDAAAREASR
jgi:hypothetical protein